MTLEEWLEKHCPEIAAAIDAEGCWQYKILPLDGESMNRLTVHITTGKTKAIKTYRIVATLAVEAVAWE